MFNAQGELLCTDVDREQVLATAKTCTAIYFFPNDVPIEDAQRRVLQDDQDILRTAMSDMRDELEELTRCS